MSKVRDHGKDLQAYEGLKELLLCRRLVPGQRIIYRDLEEILGMSKTPIMNALVRLEQENMLVSHHNRGYYVKQWSSKDIRQMFELKEKLHGILVKYAVESATAEKLADFKRALGEYLAYKSTIYDLRKFRLDMRFHIQLAKMAGNDYLTSVLSQQYSIMCCAVDLAVLTPLIEKFEQDHTLLYQAIEQKNSKEAKRVLSAHDRAGAKMVVEAMKK
jgi:DNA-binding GntR family transcriptional regulator